MKKKTFSFVMLSILLAQNFGFAANAYAVTTTEAQTETTDTAKKRGRVIELNTIFTFSNNDYFRNESTNCNN